MNQAAINYQAVGVIRSPFRTPEGAPIQPSGARGVLGRVEVQPSLEPGLKDLEGFSHLILLYHCHLAKKPALLVRPFLDQEHRGVFATRAPARPNPIGLSVVRLLRVEGCVLHLEDVDVLDGTPLLDLKPYVPEFDQPPGPVNIGWLAGRAGQAQEHKADARFKQT
ncbi:MAG: tRNA (N6-threonylcarbamoyladenosine(37)-N6)-methyltransferase TrmO [Desulfarculus sp.]|nr:MAG: tRNA (N6-threonylcarbamoyladenosine(37)-N6)-methyltransferase TrmO [Desulfarculus sp.]